MLVLSRKIKEQILIGDDIQITLLRIDGNKIRIGIDAPKQVRVIRGELTPNDDPSDELGSQGQISEREEAFAHPPTSPAGATPSQVASSRAATRFSESEAGFASPKRPVRKPRRAPLSDFMTAG